MEGINFRLNKGSKKSLETSLDRLLVNLFFLQNHPRIIQVVSRITSFSKLGQI